MYNGELQMIFVFVDQSNLFVTYSPFILEFFHHVLTGKHSRDICICVPVMLLFCCIFAKIYEGIALDSRRQEMLVVHPVPLKKGT